ncbi:hypothetical protein K492DRAFT_176850 [Lichtheimia hyalospora FSU 10163]|nr:hypothetical protein K492DRAFT_176850 [Lichtheimia hyalospora FSU 10163]
MAILSSYIASRQVLTIVIVFLASILAVNVAIGAPCNRTVTKDLGKQHYEAFLPDAL